MRSPEPIGCPLLDGPGVRVSSSRAGVIGTNNPSEPAGAAAPVMYPVTSTMTSVPSNEYTPTRPFVTRAITWLATV